MEEPLINDFPQSDEGLQLLFSYSDLQTFRKKEVLLSPDKKVNHIYFIKTGLIRSYRIIDGNDITHHFHTQNWFATDYQGYLTGHLSELYLKTVTDCTVYIIKKEVFLSLSDKHHVIERLARIIAEKAYLQMVERIKKTQTTDLRERYNLLMKESPELFKTVPQKHIASYLGVAAQSLSRIKSKKG